MASPAQRQGRELIQSLLPHGMEGPEVNIRARRTETGQAIAFSLWPHPNAATGGEYQNSVILGNTPGRHRDAALDRIRHLIERWVEIETVVKLIRDEERACDEDGPGNHVADDMTIPAWRFHCPMPLRRIMDLAGMDDAERVRMAEDSGSFAIGGYIVRLHERDGQPLPPDRRDGRRKGIGCRTVRRFSIEGRGIHFSQGISRCYLKMSATIPQTMQSALVGMPASLLMDLPGFDVPGMNISGISSTKTKNAIIVDFTRTMAMMSAAPART